MESLPARPLRILAEYIDPINRIRKANVADTIVMFGSARIQPRDRAIAQLKKLQPRRARAPHRHVAHETDRREIHRGNVALLRRGARAFATHHVMVHDAGRISRSAS